MQVYCIAPNPKYAAFVEDHYARRFRGRSEGI